MNENIKCEIPAEELDAINRGDSPSKEFQEKMAKKLSDRIKRNEGYASKINLDENGKEKVIEKPHSQPKRKMGECTKKEDMFSKYFYEKIRGDLPEIMGERNDKKSDLTNEIAQAFTIRGVRGYKDGVFSDKEIEDEPIIEMGSNNVVEEILDWYTIKLPNFNCENANFILSDINPYFAKKIEDVLAKRNKGEKELDFGFQLEEQEATRKIDNGEIPIEVLEERFMKNFKLDARKVSSLDVTDKAEKNILNVALQLCEKKIKFTPNDITDILRAKIEGEHSNWKTFVTLEKNKNLLKNESSVDGMVCQYEADTIEVNGNEYFSVFYPKYSDPRTYSPKEYAVKYRTTLLDVLHKSMRGTRDVKEIDDNWITSYDQARKIAKELYGENIPLANGIIKTASGNILIEPNSEFESMTDQEVKEEIYKRVDSQVGIQTKFNPEKKYKLVSKNIDLDRNKSNNFYFSKNKLKNIFNIKSDENIDVVIYYNQFDSLTVCLEKDTPSFIEKDKIVNKTVKSHLNISTKDLKKLLGEDRKDVSRLRFTVLIPTEKDAQIGKDRTI